ncbi:class I SAM-dependent methyltransferase, partial [Halochromatium sp.]
MRELLARIAADSDRAPGTTLVVGAGNGAELPMLRAVGQRRLILVEPHPQFANELSARISPADGEEVWTLAIAPAPNHVPAQVPAQAATQQRNLLVLTNLRYSSLCEPERLLEHGPNLRKQTPIEVRVRTLQEAIETASPQADANNLLILDAPGLSVELLRQTEASLIQRFAWIIAHASSVSGLYRGEPSYEHGTERLSALGFVRVEEDPDALYPEVVTLYRRDDHRIEVIQQERVVER